MDDDLSSETATASYRESRPDRHAHEEEGQAEAGTEGQGRTVCGEPQPEASSAALPEPDADDHVEGRHADQRAMPSAMNRAGPSCSNGPAMWRQPKGDIGSSS